MADLSDGPQDGFFSMDSCGVKQGNVGVLLLDQHDDLGAAFDHAFGASFSQIVDDAQELGSGAIFHLAQYQFLIDDVMDDVAVVLRRYQHIQAIGFA